MLAARCGNLHVTGVMLMGGGDIDRLDGGVVAKILHRSIGFASKVRFEPASGLLARIGRRD